MQRHRRSARGTAHCGGSRPRPSRDIDVNQYTVLEGNRLQRYPLKAPGGHESDRTLDADAVCPEQGNPTAVPFLQEREERVRERQATEAFHKKQAEGERPDGLARLQ